MAPDVLGYGQPVVGEQGEATLVLVGMALVVGASAEGHPHGGFGPVGACKPVAGALGVVQQFGGRRAAVAGRQQVIASVEAVVRSEEHTSELQSLMRISYAVFCLTKKHTTQKNN